MAAINFYANNQQNDFEIPLEGSGIGFYGAGGFGRSVQVDTFQSTSYITDSNGVEQGAELNNVKYIHANSGLVNGTTELDVKYIPNYQSTVNVRFTHDTAVQTQNALCYIYDRTSTDNAPSGLVCYCYETLHPEVAQDFEGSGLTEWTNTYGSESILSLAASPGCSGWYAGSGLGSEHIDTRHDYYVCLSVSPDSVGSKTLFGMSVQLEYL